MSRLTKLCRKREDKVQALAFSKAPEARLERIAMVTNRQWTDREGQPGNFHRPDGKQQMPAWNDTPTVSYRTVQQARRY